MVEGEPKTARSRRTVHLTPTAVDALNRHRVRQTEQRLRAVFWQDADLIFTNEVGRHILPTNLIRRSWVPLLERAGLPRMPFHSLRHTSASLALSQGVPVTTVSEMLGHASPSITLSVYAHVVTGGQQDAARKMESLLTAI